MRGFLIAFLIALAGMVFALYLQLFQQQTPCPLCVMQRVGLIGVGLVSLIALIHRPRRPGIRIYAGSGVVFALFGLVMAGKQVYLQFYPPSDATACAPSLSFLYHNLPLSKFLSVLLQGSGACAAVPWQFLGLSLAAWSGLGFLALILLLLWQWRLAVRR